MDTDLLTLTKAVGRVLLGKEHQVRLAFSCLLAGGGHLLIEDRPGMGKSTLAEALATVFSLAFKRVSFTSDLLPADLTGINVFHQADATFHFQPGPLFTQVLRKFPENTVLTPRVVRQRGSRSSGVSFPVTVADF